MAIGGQTIRVRDRLTVEGLSHLTPFKNCDMYVQLVDGRCKLLVVQEDDRGNGALKWWTWIPILQTYEV